MLLRIKKSQLSKSPPRLIIVEGFWNMGKTTFINELAKQGKFTLIDEPNHLVNEVNIKDPHEWYLEEHLARQKKAEHLIERSKRVIMERSILSSFALSYAQTKMITKDGLNVLKSLPMLKQSLIIFLYADKQFITREARGIEDSFVRDLVIKNKGFYKNYINFYKDILSGVVGNMLYLNVAPDGEFLDPGELVGLLKKNETI